MDVSKRTLGLGTENAFVVLAEVNALLREGKDVVSFCIGQPDFDTSQHIKDAAIKAINDGKTGYTDSAGILPAREAVARYLSRTRKINVKPEHVVIANGAKPFIAYTIACTTDYGVGDEVIYPNPGFPIYQSQIIANGAVPVPLPLSEKRKFSFDIEELKARISNRTKLLIINTPHNPTGGKLEEDDLKEVASLAKKHDFWVYADEVYCTLSYDKEFKSIASLPDMYERTIVSDGASKSYAMTGWRMGYIANSTLAPHIARWVTNTESWANHMSQYALAAALVSIFDLKEMEIFLEELLTRGELCDVTLRWRLLELLAQGVSQRKIAEDLQISLCKITRGSRILKNKNAVSSKILRAARAND